MKISRGYKFKLDPTDAQADAFARNVGVCRVVYNLALEQRRDHYRQFRRATGYGISFASQCRELTELRAEVDWIAEGSLTAQQQALRDLATAYSNFFAGRADYPTFRRKGVNESFRFQGREVAFRRLNKSWGLAKLPKIGEVRFRWTRDIPGKLKNVTISLDQLGWHISFATEREEAVARHTGPSVGIDRGVVEPIAYSDGTFAAFPKAQIKRLEKRARKAANALSRTRPAPQWRLRRPTTSSAGPSSGGLSLSPTHLAAAAVCATSPRLRSLRSLARAFPPSLCPDMGFASVVPETISRPASILSRATGMARSQACDPVPQKHCAWK